MTSFFSGAQENLALAHETALVFNKLTSRNQGASQEKPNLWSNQQSQTATLQELEGMGVRRVNKSAEAIVRMGEVAATQEKLTVVDQLTGILNQRGYEQALSRMTAEVRRLNYKLPEGNLPQGLAIIMFDSIKFKAINDNFGQPNGGLALQQIADVLRENSRAGDAVARQGGDEFSHILPAESQESIEDLLRSSRLEKINSEIRLKLLQVLPPQYKDLPEESGSLRAGVVFLTPEDLRSDMLQEIIARKTAEVTVEMKKTKRK